MEIFYGNFGYLFIVKKLLSSYSSFIPVVIQSELMGHGITFFIRTRKFFIFANLSLYLLNFILKLPFRYKKYVHLNDILNNKCRRIHIFFYKRPHFQVEPRVAIKIPKMRLNKVAMKLLSIFGIKAKVAIVVTQF